jgi:hypothetical protein
MFGENLLRQIHVVKSRGALAQAISAERQTIEIPEIDEHSAAMARVIQSQRKTPLDVGQTRGDEFVRFQRVQRTVPRSCRHE